MKLTRKELSYKSTFYKSTLASVVAVCALTAISCSKKEDNETDAQTTDDVVVMETTPEVIVPEMTCDDKTALNVLNKSLRDSLAGSASSLIQTYANRTGTSVAQDGVNTIIDSILIDVANPTALQPANANGMVTCNASLSMTLPNNDVNRAIEVYKSLGGSTLNQTMAAQNITVNNNMLVSRSFDYVVGMQGGQATAKIVGEPEILAAAADVIAKSKLKEALDASRPVVSNSASRPARAQPKPATPPQPAAKPKPAPKPAPATRPVQPASPTESSEPTRSESKPLEISPTPSDLQTPDAAGSSNTGSAAKKPEQTHEFSVPTDESIEMVIIEEEGTY